MSWPHDCNTLALPLFDITYRWSDELFSYEWTWELSALLAAVASLKNWGLSPCHLSPLVTPIPPCRSLLSGNNSGNYHYKFCLGTICFEGLKHKIKVSIGLDFLLSIFVWYSQFILINPKFSILEYIQLGNGYGSRPMSFGYVVEIENKSKNLHFERMCL